MKPLSACRLYTFVDTAYLDGRSPVEIAKQLCAGGSDVIQLRAKTSSEEEVQRLAELILPITRAAKVYLVINDFLAVAENVGAEFCHLGQEDFFDAGHTHISQIRPPQSALRIGLSTHAPEQAARAVAAGADYVAIGPIYATGTKPTAKPVTLDYVRWAEKNISISWFAIGGINLDTIDDVLAAGARRVCIVSAILNSSNIAKTCSEFRQRVDSAPFK
ncbi:MAG: thiamine phosphate synthase [Verrucomicrobia bacterium]|nr:thiamine phosphate synthase [Verrucomicrobiota bacterium]